MKKVCILLFVVAFLLDSCNKIPDKSVSEKLSTKELSKVIKSDTSFTDFYEHIREQVDDMSDIKKATYNDITYRRMFRYYKFLQDTTFWNPLSKQWEEEWDSEYGIYLQKADSVLNYWKKYLDEKSLGKYVKIELADIDKEYYSYAAGLKEVSLGFRFTPLQGKIEQLNFNYSYVAKINESSKLYDKNYCISTSPFSGPTIRYWKVDYSEEDRFERHNVETFLRDYNLYIEITDIRKDGKNISSRDFSVPDEVSQCLDYEKDYPFLFEYSKSDLIKNLIYREYVTEMDYQVKKGDEIREKKDKLCFDFLNEMIEE